MKNLAIEQALKYGAIKREELNSIIWPDKNTDQYHEMVGFEKGIVWYQEYLKTLIEE